MQVISNVDGTVTYERDFLSPVEADHLFHFCHEQLPWECDQITLFGKKHWIPRKQVYMADDESLNYAYSGHQMQVHSFCSELEEIKSRLEQYLQIKFNAMLANLYENGQHSNGWHADNEKELGKQPVIASISLGETRKFRIRHNRKEIKEDILLEHGSLLVMKGAFQENWKHSIPKTAKKVAPRVNLTFRRIIS